ncbi:MAG: methyltransferase domain-containing protein, partial [Candidatus Acidiferrales bacterium]
MHTWNPNQYLKFESERTRPCQDLANRVLVEHPRRVIDLGCGPGNSTAVLARRWPEAEITGLDSSSDMIAAARQALPRVQWITGGIENWAAGTEDSDRYDVVFSNAAFQWIGDHARSFPQIFNRVAPGGALAAQMPASHSDPVHRLMREMARSAAWQTSFSNGVKEWRTESVAYYYDVLSPLAAQLDIWETKYLQVMPGLESIVEFFKGTALRPYLGLLPTETERARFLAEYMENLRPLYP